MEDVSGYPETEGMVDCGGGGSFGATLAARVSKKDFIVCKSSRDHGLF
jgi:hypothetical protein